MRQLIPFILLLISTHNVFACGPWYPEKEEVRFKLLAPELFDDGGMRPFYYTSGYIYDNYQHVSTSDRNVDDWMKEVGDKVSREDVFDAIYRLSKAEILDPTSQHPFVLEMRKKGNEAALEYLGFAKHYSYLNSTSSDPWEREEDDLKKMRSTAIQFALKNAKSASNPTIAKRYAFQAVRLAYYNSEHKVLEATYEQYFKGSRASTIDAWAFYYYTWLQDEGVEQNFALTQLFPTIPSKRQGIFNLYRWRIEESEVLKQAKTNKERANVMAFYLMRNQGRALNKLRELVALDPENELIEFLLIRELNKIEDWVMGPTYTAFAPVLRPNVDHYSAEERLIKEAVFSDSRYAIMVLNWLKSKPSLFDEALYLSVKGDLELITHQPIQAEQTFKNTHFTNDRLENWRQRMLEVCKVANGNTLKGIDFNVFYQGDYESNDRFLFLIGRLLEFRGDISDAGIVFSAVNSDPNIHFYHHFAWSEPKGLSIYNNSFYTDYYEYFDANYSGKVVHDMLERAKEISMHSDDTLLVKMAQRIASDSVHLTDLIGTKYLREENLAMAASFLKAVPDSYWKSPDRAYLTNLAANPFYAHFYSEHKRTKGDTVTYTKYEVVRKLIDLIDLAHNQQGDERAKTEFTIANCYFNMTNYGNSWIMKHSWWSVNTYSTIYADNDDYFKCLNASDYYLKAYNSATTPAFKALCLRMAGRCETYKFKFENAFDYDRDYDQEGGYDEFVFQQNSRYKQLKNEYPEFERELITNCHSFNRFYRSI